MFKSQYEVIGYFTLLASLTSRYSYAKPTLFNRRFHFRLWRKHWIENIQETTLQRFPTPSYLYFDIWIMWTTDILQPHSKFCQILYDIPWSWQYHSCEYFADFYGFLVNNIHIQNINYFRSDLFHLRILWMDIR